MDEAGRRPGIGAVFASYEGLLVAVSGTSQAEAEAPAAMAPASLEPVRAAAGGALSLGALRQLVIVGEESKLALIRVGPVTVGLRSPTSVSLAVTTAV